MFNTVFKVLLLTAWLVSTAWLIRFEAFPHWFDDTIQGYRDLARDLPAMRDTWMKVVADGQHVGYLNSTIEMEEVEGREQLLMTTQLMLRIQFQGRYENLRFGNEVRLNARHEMIGSVSDFSLGSFSGDLTLDPMEEGEGYRLDIEVNDVKFSRTVDVPKQAVISSPLMDSGLRSVRPGQVIRIRTLDPFSVTGDLQTVEIEGLSVSEKMIPGEERPVRVTRVETRFGDLTLESEVDEYGRVLWQRTPFGLTFVISRPQEAMKVPSENAVDPSALLSGASLPSFLPSSMPQLP